jgi:heme-degrading monooxygenase HmoA
MGGNGDGGQLFRVLLRLEIHPGMERQFEHTWREIGEMIAGHPAIRGQWLLRGAEEPATYYIISDWADERQFREFERSAAHLEHRKRLNPCRSGVAMTTMHVVHHLDGAAVAAP